MVLFFFLSRWWDNGEGQGMKIKWWIRWWWWWWFTQYSTQFSTHLHSYPPSPTQMYPHNLHTFLTSPTYSTLTPTYTNLATLQPLPTYIHTNLTSFFLPKHTNTTFPPTNLPTHQPTNQPDFLTCLTTFTYFHIHLSLFQLRRHT